MCSNSSRRQQKRSCLGWDHKCRAHVRNGSDTWIFLGVQDIRCDWCGVSDLGRVRAQGGGEWSFFANQAWDSCPSALKQQTVWVENRRHRGRGEVVHLNLERNKLRLCLPRGRCLKKPARRAQANHASTYRTVGAHGFGHANALQSISEAVEVSFLFSFISNQVFFSVSQYPPQKK